jgi:hypothetical protein
MFHSKKSFLVIVSGVLSAMLIVAAVAVANDNGQAAAKKKVTFTSKQKKAINKMIDAKIKKISIPTVPAGPAAYTARNAAQVNIPSALATETDVLSKSIPAGKYVVSGHVNGFYVTDNPADEANLVCRLRLNGTTIQQAQAGNDAGIFLFLATAGTLNMSFDTTVDAAAASTLKIDCSGGYDSPGAQVGEYVGAEQAVLNAVTVGSIG